MATRLTKSKAKQVLLYDPKLDKKLTQHERLVKEFLKNKIKKTIK